MKNLFFLNHTISFLLLFSCGESITHQNWKKGNLHTHSLWSDGDDFPEMIIQWYKDHDYQFIALSDHNIIADSEFWYTLREREIKNKTLEKYQNRFGDWVEIKEESGITSVRLKTFEEFKSKLEVKDSFLIIKSEEVTSSESIRGKPSSEFSISQEIPLNLSKKDLVSSLFSHKES